MCRVTTTKIENGLIDSEKVVTIEIFDGSTEEISVHESAIDNQNRLETAFVQENNALKTVLVELPRESASGRRRVWVKKSIVRGNLYGAHGQGDSSSR